MDEAKDVVDDDPPLLHRADDGGEVVVGDHHVGSFLRDFGALDAHGDADVGFLQGRGVVHPIAGHRDHLSVQLQRLDDLQFVLRRDTGEHGRVGNNRLPPCCIQAAQLAGMHGPQGTTLGIAVDSQLARDLGGRRRLVAGDHDGADARLAAGVHGGPRLVAERIDHADLADEDQFPAQVVTAIALRQLPVRQPKHAQGGAGQLAVGLFPVLPVGRRQRRNARGAELRNACCEQRSGRALHIRDCLALWRAVHRDHALGLAAERDLGNAWVLALHRRAVQPAFFRSDNQRRFGRVAQDGGIAVLAVDLRVVAQQADPQREVQWLIGARLEVLFRDAELPGRRIAGAGDLEPAFTDLERADGHLIAGQRPRLVGADYRRRAERFDGGQAANKRVHARHALHPQRQRHGSHGRQALGHRRDRQRDAHLEHVQEAVAPQPAGHHDHRAEHQDNQQQGAAELGKLGFQRGSARAHPLDERADLAHLGQHARGSDDEFAAAIGDGGPQVHHVDPVADRRVAIGKGICGLGDGEGLAGQRGLLQLQPHVLHDAAVGRYPRTGAEDGHVTGHQFRCGDLPFLSLAKDVGHWHGLLAQRVQRRLRLPLGDETDHRVQDNDGQNGNCLDVFPEREGNPAGRQQQHHDEAAELVDEDRQG